LLWCEPLWFGCGPSTLFGASRPRSPPQSNCIRLDSIGWHSRFGWSPNQISIFSLLIIVNRSCICSYFLAEFSLARGSSWVFSLIALFETENDAVPNWIECILRMYIILLCSIPSLYPVWESFGCPMIVFSTFEVSTRYAHSFACSALQETQVMPLADLNIFYPFHTLLLMKSFVPEALLWSMRRALVPCIIPSTHIPLSSEKQVVKYSCKLYMSAY
jgi:hypothetical protein